MKIIAEQIIKFSHPSYDVRVHVAVNPDETAFPREQFVRLKEIVHQNPTANRAELAKMFIEESNVVMAEVTHEGEGVVLHKVWLG